jgi:hypothetical protein
MAVDLSKHTETQQPLFKIKKNASTGKYDHRGVLSCKPPKQKPAMTTLCVFQYTSISTYIEMGHGKVYLRFHEVVGCMRLPHSTVDSFPHNILPVRTYPRIKAPELNNEFTNTRRRGIYTL